MYGVAVPSLAAAAAAAAAAAFFFPLFLGGLEKKSEKMRTKYCG
jgi:hypothetical protein